MINGEGTGKAASPKPSDQKSDDGDASSSRYSSCGESEFDRYCSANSAMGTPSMCSTITVFNDCVGESEFGSVRNFGFGEESGGLENFSLGERNCEEIGTCSGDRKIEFCNGNNDGIREKKPGLNYGSSGFELYGSDELDLGGGSSLNELMSWKVEPESSLPLKGISEFGNVFSKVDGGEDGEDSLMAKKGVDEIGVTGNSSVEQMCTQEANESVSVGNDSKSSAEAEKCSLDCIAGGEDGNCFNGLEPEPDFYDDIKERERPEDGNSSRNEQSDGEDSIYNCGTDDEDKSGSNYQRNVNYLQEVRRKNENPLLINSSVAFGSEDWDDFMQESEGTRQASDLFTKTVSQNQAEKSVETKGEMLDSTSVTATGFLRTRQNEKGQSLTDMTVPSNQVEGDNTLDDIAYNSEVPADFLNFGDSKVVEDVKDIPVASYQVQGSHHSIEITKSAFTIPPSFERVHETEQEETSHVSCTNDQVRGGDELADYSKKFELDSLEENVPVKSGFNNMNKSQGHQNMTTEESINIDDSRISKSPALSNSKIKLEPLDDESANQLSSHSTVSSRNTKSDFLEDCKPKTDRSGFGTNIRKNPPVSEDHVEAHPTAVKTNDLELNEFYDEVVLEMEEILLDSSETPGAWFPHSNRASQSQLSLPLRDGGTSASTSGTDVTHLVIQHPLRIDGIEVVGARQKKGDVSLSERLVGVKGYTVYKIKVWSGKDQWEVERRYRDFFTMYRRLKSLCSSQGWILPSAWAAVEKEPRKFFGNASPDVIAERSILIQECLHSILHPKFFATSPSALIWFLFPQGSVPSSPGSNTVTPRSTSRGDGDNITLGKTISLIVEIQPYKSTKQMLEAQHYTCAGCYKHFDDGKTLIRDFAQTLGWGKPRLCEYTSQLFCSSCHTNETAVLPARVLHNWDFMQYPVSQLAKSYLDSIHDQPMLCVSAVNPFLFSKVPALLHVMGVRRKIGSMLSYVRCSFRGSINKVLGSRRYLLESNDFFALRDLIDLSKGAFAVLPVMAETVLKKIVEHITDQCLICCDVGVPCSARQACNDPSSLIFPFQEVDIEKCPSCESVFHKPCFKKLTDCPCGARLRVDDRWAGGESSGALDLLGKGLSSGLNVGFLAGLFTKAKPENLGVHKDSDNVILMGSLPSTSL
ncbi:Phox domain containing protein [Parasponia andersonii]|uniref:Phox domain containing protein n=1 Tax=Parasponia andersonii TaxID=3476 RepID=A0A2P5DFY3_PARAD|nr:Phox domain containing protein [Parasponia andersonii]